jgi:hypothetical protein
MKLLPIWGRRSRPSVALLLFALLCGSGPSAVSSAQTQPATSSRGMVTELSARAKLIRWPLAWQRGDVRL